jgi:hypothetical protein
MSEAAGRIALFGSAHAHIALTWLSSEGDTSPRRTYALAALGSDGLLRVRRIVVEPDGSILPDGEVLDVGDGPFEDVVQLRWYDAEADQPSELVVVTNDGAVSVWSLDEREMRWSAEKLAHAPERHVELAKGAGARLAHVDESGRRVVVHLLGGGSAPLHGDPKSRPDTPVRGLTFRGEDLYVLRGGETPVLERWKITPK